MLCARKDLHAEFFALSIHCRVKKPLKRPRGRPSLSRVRIQVTMSPETRDALAELAQAGNMTQGECIEEALMQWIKRRNKAK